MNSHVFLQRQQAAAQSSHPAEAVDIPEINKCCEPSLKTKQTPNKMAAKRLWVYMLWMEIRLATFKKGCIKKTQQTMK